MQLRIFITTPAIKSGSSVLAWLLGQHSKLGYYVPEIVELGAMLNVLDHIPMWRKQAGPAQFGVGEAGILSQIQTFTDSIMNPNKLENCAVKFTNFGSYNWLSHVFPNDKIVVIVRNPLDWYASAKGWNTYRRGSWNIDAIDRFMLNAARSLQHKADQKIVHFEDLIHRPQEVMHAIHTYIGWECEPIDLTNQVEVFNRFTSDKAATFDVPIDGLIKTPIGRKYLLSNEETDRALTWMAQPIFSETFYHEDRRLI